MKKTWIIIGIVVALLVLWCASAYNSFVRLDQEVAGQWGKVETQYQRRFDLIPNLVESVKGIFEQEKEVFGALAEARTRYAGASTPDARAAAATGVESALARLLVVMENYPQLRSSEAVTTLMAQLEGTENRISVERSRYNDAVGAYNVAIRRFPSNIMAGVFGFSTPKAFFEAATGAENAPAVDLTK